MTTLHIRLLGDFHLNFGEGSNCGPAHSVNTPRLQSLFGYLLLHRHAPQARQHLAFTFWPDASESQARNNLRQMLHQLRNALPDAGLFLRADAATVWWVPDTGYHLDVAEFEAAVALATGDDRTSDRDTTRQALQTAIALYRGDLLPSCYDEWIPTKREHLRQQCLQVYRRLVQLLEEARDYGAALEYAQRLLQLDTLDETTYLCLMRLHALNNDRASALRVYQNCVTTLQRELEVMPGEGIQVAYERLHRLDVRTGDLTTASASLSGTTPLIGRQPEWEKLRSLWQRAGSGQPALALITGEAGMGKTRLAEELIEWAGRQGIVTARTRAYAAEGRLSYGPISEWLRSGMLAPAVARLDKIWLSEIARLLPEILASHPDLPAPGPLAEYWQRQRFFEALARGLLAVNAPAVLLIDDLQWCDPETLEWLHFLLRFDPAARLLVIGTARVEEMNENPALMTLLQTLQVAGRVCEFALGPLDATEVAKLATSIRERELEVAETMRLFRETEGNPLFVVEMARAVAWGSETVEQETQPLRPARSDFQSLPPKVHAVIAGRLNQLSHVARELTGVAAVVGRAFTLDILAHVFRAQEESLVDALDELWRRRIIRVQSARTYDFSHDKLRDVAYAELSPMQQRALHQRVALALETLYATDLEPLCAQLAAHYEQAGFEATAIGYHLRAGGVAQRVYATQEAMSHYRRGLALLANQPDGAKRDRTELALQTALVVPLATVAGYGSTDLIQACHRAHTLAQQLGQSPDPSVLRALAIGSVGRIWLQQAYELGEQLLALARRDQDPVLFTEAYYVLGVSAFFQGEFRRARGHLEQAIANYDLTRSPVHVTRYAQDPKVICLCRLALVLWYLGYFDQAERTCQAALTFAHDLGHPFSLVYCLYWTALVHQHRRDTDATLAHVETCIALAQEHQFATFYHWAMGLRGWVLAEQGNIADGIKQAIAGIEGARATGTENQQGFSSGLLAVQYGKLGDPARGLSLLDEVLARNATRGEHWCEAELLRHRGEMLLKLHGDNTLGAAEAEVAFLNALALARQQEVKALELRAAVSLARLWVREGRQADARQLLLPIFGWFREGFETPDLQEAKSLLESQLTPR